MSTNCCSKIFFTYQKTNYVIEDFALEDTRVTQNLVKLFQRKKGTLFRANEKGELHEIKKSREEFDYKWDRKKDNIKIRAVIDEALLQFNDFLSRQDKKVAEAAVKYLFDPKGKYGIGRLGKALYNHKLLKCDNTLSRYCISSNTVRLKLSDHQFLDVTSEKLGGQMTLPFILGLDLGNAKLNHNLWMLLKRKKGQIYHVNQEGKLEKVKTMWTYRPMKTDQEAKVQAAVTEVLKGLNLYLTKTTITEVHQLVIKHIFSANSPLCRMNRETFNRGAIEENSILEKILNKDLEQKRKHLTQALIALRDAKTECAKKNAKLHMEKAFMNLVVEEFKFAQQLGIDLERITEGGTGGARCGRDRYGRKSLVVKPADEGQGLLGFNNPNLLQRLKRIFMSTKPCLEGNSEPMNEFDAWAWDRSFDVWTIPPTDVRFVSSRDFIGYDYKECSVQMFVENCKSLGEYVGISPRIQWLPRSFLRWYSGSAYNTSCFYSLGQRENIKEELMEKLPVELIAKIGLLSKGIEETDSHFENILVLLSKVAPHATLDPIFNGDQKISDEKIENFVGHFFQENGTQDLLQHLLCSKKVTIDHKEMRISLIKPDSGASNPNTHPRWWEYFSKRYSGLFELLPHFEGLFTPEAKQIIAGKQDIFAKYLLEKGARNLRDIMKHEDFEEFWCEEKNRKLLKRWIFEMDVNAEYYLRLGLMRKLFKATKENAQKGPYFHKLFNYHLVRIRGNLQTRMDSFRVLRKYLHSDRHPMRSVFKNVKDEEDFKKELLDLDDGFPALMKFWQKKPVRKGALPKKEFSFSLERNYLVDWFGEV